MRRFISRTSGLALAITTVFAVSGCNESSTGATATPAKATGTNAAGEKTWQVVTTTGMVTDIVREIAGPRADVVALMGAGVDPHLYKPTRNDMKRLLDADAVFYSGLVLEGRMTDTFTQLAGQGKKVVPVTAGLDESRLREPPEFSGHYDPHVWMDVMLWSDCVRSVGDELAKFDAAHADEFRLRTDAYCARLTELDAYVEKVIASIPESQRVLVTAHDAFGYFGQRYKLEVRSVQGVTTESEAGVQDVNRLVDFLVERKLPAIFVESSVNSKNITAVIEGCQSRGVTVKIGAELYSDALGEAGTYEGTYLGMIDANATRIARALGGDAPESGWQGKLTH
ncbi:MAG: zinc ABC transporter substrate-binding protein [Planctomycetaceae bacterium]|nr:zinc ABC transporter substrate-binding protein [Planctomycetaceae bacterium]